MEDCRWMRGKMSLIPVLSVPSHVHWGNLQDNAEKLLTQDRSSWLGIHSVASKRRPQTPDEERWHTTRVKKHPVFTNEATTPSLPREAILDFTTRPLQSLICGPRIPPRIILLCLVTHHTHTQATTMAIIAPATFLPTPLTCLSSSHTVCWVHPALYSFTANSFCGALIPLSWTSHRWWSHGYILPRWQHPYTPILKPSSRLLNS